VQQRHRGTGARLPQEDRALLLTEADTHPLTGGPPLLEFVPAAVHHRRDGGLAYGSWVGSIGAWAGSTGAWGTASMSAAAAAARFSSLTASQISSR
jgi:hypothetical protein